MATAEKLQFGADHTIFDGLSAKIQTKLMKTPFIDEDDLVGGTTDEILRTAAAEKVLMNDFGAVHIALLTEIRKIDRQVQGQQEPIDEDTLWRNGQILLKVLANEVIVIPAEPLRTQGTRYLDETYVRNHGVAPPSYQYVFSEHPHAVCALKDVLLPSIHTDVITALQGVGMRIMGDFHSAYIYQLGLSVTTQLQEEGEALGVPSHRMSVWEQQRRVKIFDEPMNLFARLNIDIFGFGKASDFVDSCLKESETEMHKLFKRDVMGRDFRSINPPSSSSRVSTDAQMTQFDQGDQDAVAAIEAAEAEYNRVESLPVYAVQEILEHKVDEGVGYLLIWWKGYPKDEAEWEPMYNVSEEAVHAYFSAQQSGDDDGDDDGDQLMASVPEVGMPRYARDSSTRPDEFKEKPDMSIDVTLPNDETIVVIKVEFLSEKANQVEHLVRLFGYLAHMLKSINRGFAIGFCVRRTRFFVVVAFKRFGRVHWWRTNGVRVVSRRAHVTFGDVFLSVARCNIQKLGIFPQSVERWSLRRCIGFGGEASVFSAGNVADDIQVVNFGGKELTLYHQNGQNERAIKFWRHLTNWKRCQDVMADLTLLNARFPCTEHVVGIQQWYREGLVGIMELGAPCFVGIDLEKWIDLARWLSDFHAYSNLVHGDITPGNIVMARNGCLKLTDWGSCVLAGSAVTHNSMTTIAFFPEALNEGTASVWKDQVMFLRTVVWVSRVRDQNPILLGNWPRETYIPRPKVDNATLCTLVGSLFSGRVLASTPMDVDEVY